MCPFSFQEEKEEALAISLKYNVHKNLGECYLVEGNVQAAQEEMLTAVDIDSGDVTLWFKIAGGWAPKGSKVGTSLLGKRNPRLYRVRPVYSDFSKLPATTFVTVVPDILNCR